MTALIIPTDGMVITQDTHFAPGVYHLPNGVQIAADNITLEGTDTLIISSTQTGTALQAQGRQHITVKGLSVTGFYHGLRFDDCDNITLENITVRGTQEIKDIETFLYLWHPIEKTYGGGILLHNVKNSTVRHCDLQHQMNGLLLYGCSGLTIENNNASFNSGWGIYLSAANDNLIQNNRLDFCNRVFRRPEDGSIRVEADAAGIVLVMSSSRNRFLHNSCLCGGDGIFVAGYYYPGGITPCNDNLFENNDCRLSSNNAIEATFSRGNIFRRNDCSRSNYGLWLGYSWDNLLEDNQVEFNRWVGIAIEHGHDFVLRNNTIRLNGEGVRLWTRGAVGDAVLRDWQGYEVAYNMTLENNLFETNRIGFAGYTNDNMPDFECHHFQLRGNTFKDNRIGARFRRVRDCSVDHNTFIGNVEAALQLEDKPGVRVGENQIS
jgi:parallel beta-helix repeat protein